MGSFGMHTSRLRDAVVSLRLDPAYDPDYLAAAGYEPRYPWWDLEIDFGSEAYQRTTGRALAEGRCRVRPIDKRRWAGDMETFATLWTLAFASSGRVILVRAGTSRAIRLVQGGA